MTHIAGHRSKWLNWSGDRLVELHVNTYLDFILNLAFIEEDTEFLPRKLTFPKRLSATFLGKKVSTHNIYLPKTITINYTIKSFGNSVRS